MYISTRLYAHTCIQVDLSSFVRTARCAPTASSPSHFGHAPRPQRWRARRRRLFARARHRTTAMFSCCCCDAASGGAQVICPMSSFDEASGPYAQWWGAADGAKSDEAKADIGEASGEVALYRLGSDAGVAHGQPETALRQPRRPGVLP